MFISLSYYENPVLGKKENWQHLRRQKPEHEPTKWCRSPTEMHLPYATTADADNGSQTIYWMGAEVLELGLASTLTFFIWIYVQLSVEYFDSSRISWYY